MVDSAHSVQGTAPKAPLPSPAVPSSSGEPITAVLFDFGGVITSSPFEAFNRLEAEAGVPADTIRTINATDPDANAWARLERSEVGVGEFAELFEAEAAALGYELSGKAVLGCLSGDLRPQMVQALDRLVAGGCRIGCITNNVRRGHGPSMADSEDAASEVAQVMARFEMVVQSSAEGVRKPDPRIYQLALERMGLAASQTAYLDDLGINCKPARELGMATIKVVDPDQALKELEQLVGFALG